MYSTTPKYSPVSFCKFLQLTFPNNETGGTPRTTYVNIYLTSHTCLPKGSSVIKGNLKSKCYNTQASGLVSYQYLMLCCTVAFILSQRCKFKSAFLSSFLLSFLPLFINSFTHSLIHSFTYSFTLSFITYFPFLI